MSLQKFLAHSLLTTTLIALMVSTGRADTSIVNDNFDSYPTNDNHASLYATWVPRNGKGDAAPANPDDGILTNETLDVDGNFPGVTGNAVDHLGGSILQHAGLTAATAINPSATQSIHIQGDIFVGNDGNSRTSIGLRNRTTTGNILELGTYHSKMDSLNPFEIGGEVPEATTYGYRLRVFGDLGGAMVQEPNWYFFQFDAALDLQGATDGNGDPIGDGIVNPLDIGAGWHTYSATITPDTISLELDLYRDGLDNGATLTAGSDVAGVDASITYDVSTRLQGFDSLRIGSPSGATSPNGVAFDNVSLSLVDVGGGGGSDADGDGDVDGTDFLKLQRDDPSAIAQWQTDYSSGALQASLSAVPEPASLSLVFLATAGLLISRRR